MILIIIASQNAIFSVSTLQHGSPILGGYEMNLAFEIDNIFCIFNFALTAPDDIGKDASFDFTGCNHLKIVAAGVSGSKRTG